MTKLRPDLSGAHFFMAMDAISIVRLRFCAIKKIAGTEGGYRRPKMKNRYIKVLAKRNSVYICFNLYYVDYESIAIP